MTVIYGTDQKDKIDALDGVTDQRDLIFGRGGADEIHGLGGDDIIKGGGGADTIYGGSGTDEVDYGDSDEGVSVYLSPFYGLTGGWHGTAAGDTYYSIENVSGSGYEDHIYGNDVANALRGWGGADTLYGWGDTDVLEGGNGDDHLSGGAGADHLFGGDGSDWADYRESPVAVTVALKTGLALHGDAEGDTFDSIENLGGSNYDDHLYGDDNPNRISGSEGNDVLKGLGGDDVLNGSWHEDTLIGGTGVDVLTGGADDKADRFIWTDTNETGVTAATADRITDFNYDDGDRIDLSGIDADVVVAAGNQAFTFIGMNAFSGTPGEINYQYIDGNTYIQLQTGTSADVEGMIRIDGIVTPQASWFVL